MLTELEVTKLKQHDELDPKERANLDYYIAQKLKKSLSEIGEIDFALISIPEKNAKRVIDDQMVAALFRLTENVLKIAGYVPLDHDPQGTAFVSRSDSPTEKKDGSLEIITRISPASKQDFARALLLADHLEKLKAFGIPKLQTKVSYSPYMLPVDYPDVPSQSICRNRCREVSHKVTCFL